MKLKNLLITIAVALTLSGALAEASPIWPAPILDGGCNSKIVFDYWLGCVPIFKAVCD